MKIELKTNGYAAESLQPMINIFDKVAERLFPECTVKHFYYGNYLDMADIVLASGKYAHFNIASKRVSLTGYTCSSEELAKFESMTHNDELYDGRLLKIAEK
jgi:hypothetical protein